MPALLAERGPPPLAAVGEEMSREIDRERNVLDLFYRSALAAYEGDREGWARNAAQLEAVRGDNPYLRWFAGRQSE